MRHTGTYLPHPASLRADWLARVTVLFVAGALLFLLYGNWFYRATPPALHGVWFLLGPLVLLTDFLNPLYISYVSFFALYASGLMVIVGCLRSGYVTGVARTLAGAALLFALLFPLLLPAMYGDYEPYARPAAGYTLDWITPPSNSWSSAFRSAQRVHEKRGCTYLLQGWSADNKLYIGSDCSSAIWAYDPVTGKRSETEGNLPTMTARGSELVDRGKGIPGGSWHYPAQPPGFDTATRNDFIVYETARSRDGQWTAAAIMNYYGPTDVVILRADDPSG